VRLMASTRFHSSSGMSTSRNGFSTPALFTSRSTGPPSASRASANIATTSASFETSALTAMPPTSFASSSAGAASPT
jgi:hypothetical protein